MPRLRVLNQDEVPQDVGEAFDRFMKVRGNIPNMFRTLARRPQIMLTMEAHMNAVLNTGTVDSALKELVVVRTSANNKCAY
jgi:alkylhydroperoxidase family enzyme